jgi:hypothetical protein
MHISNNESWVKSVADKMVTSLDVLPSLILPESNFYQLQLFEELSYVGIEVLTPVVMKIPVFWDMTPCSPLKVNGHLGRT